MDLSAPLAWLVAGIAPGPDRFLAELGNWLLPDGLPLAGGALTVALPHPIIARRTGCGGRKPGVVIEALGFAASPLSQAGHDWLAGLGPVQENTVGPVPDSPVLGWAANYSRRTCPATPIGHSSAVRSQPPVSAAAA